MILREIIRQLEALAPREAACDWDNPGLLVGRGDWEITKVYVALDATEQVVEAAVAAGAELILTHHPILFHAVKQVNDETPLGRKLLTLIRNDVAVYSMHTNFDSCPGGMGDLVCAQLGLENLGPMESSSYQEANVVVTEAAAEGRQVNQRYGIGFVAELPETMTVRELAALVKERFGLPFVNFFDAERPIRRIACCPGSGRGEMENVLHCHVDAFLTGDMGHHDGLEYVEEGISLLDAGHYGLEHVFVPAAAAYMRQHFPEIEVLEAELRFPIEAV